MKTPVLDTVFFDAGNTLFFEKPWRWEIYAETGRDAGLAIDTADMREAMIRVHGELPQRVGSHYRYTDGWFKEYIPRIFSAFGARPEQIPDISEKLFARFRNPETFHLFPETRKVLEDFRKKGIRMAVISNWSTRLPRLMRDLDLDRYFEFILSSAIEETEKPEKPLFLRALSMIGADPGKALHVGDSLEKDVAGAQGAGIIGVFLNRDGHPSPPEGIPVIHGLQELMNIVENGP